MKNSLYMFMAVASAMVLSACSEKQETPAGVVPLSFGASCDYDDVKTILGDDGHAVLWEASDQIGVSGGTGAFEIKPSISVPQSKVTFTGEAAQAEVYYGVYPYSALSGWNGSVASMNLMQVQPARKGSFAAGLNISVASTAAAEMNLQFRNVLGYLKFTVGEASGGITKVIVSSVGGEKLSGEFTVDCSDPLKLVPGSGEQTYSSVAISSEESLAQGDYYIAMFPGTYSKGLKFAVYGPQGVATKVILADKSGNPLKLERGKVNSLGTIDVTKWTSSVERTAELATMTYNARCKNLEESGDPEYQSWESRKGKIVTMINDVKPDLIGFQETVKEQAEYLREELTDYVWDGYVPAGDTDGQPDILNSIFYRKDVFKLLADGTQYFTTDGTYGRMPSSWGGSSNLDISHRYFRWLKLEYLPSAVSGKDVAGDDVTAAGRTVWVFNTHLPVNKNDVDNTAARKECIRVIVAKIKELCAEDDVVFLTGDMNASYDPNQTDTHGQVMAQAETWLDDAWQNTDDKDNYYSAGGWTGIQNYGIGSIDHVFYRNVGPIKYRTITNRYGSETNLSDHLPVNFVSRMTYQVPVVQAFNAYWEDNFGGADNYEEGNMEGFGTEDSFHFKEN